MKYRISEMAKLMDISPNTLRFFEQKNLIPAPTREEDSTYRKYDIWNLCHLADYQIYKGFGLSTKEFLTFRNESDVSSALNSLRIRSKEIEKELAMMHMIKERLDQNIAHIEALEYNLNRCWIRHESPKYVLPFLTSNQNGEGEVDLHNGALSEWMHGFPFVAIFSSATLDECLQGDPSLHFSLVIDQKYAEFLELPTEHALKIPEREVIFTTVKLERMRYADRTTLQPLLSFSQETGLLADDTVYWTRLFAEKVTSPHPNRYFEIVLPLK